MRRHLSRSLVVLPLLSLVAIAADPATQPAAVDHAAAPRVPALVADGANRDALSISRRQVSVAINGYAARTTTTITFKNSADRVLEGELVFPIPDGATVTGYALDVNGKLVDGVAVEKQAARVSYEQEVHKGIDPGLLEHVAGNNFRTRVYPIPARGTRTVSVQYVSELGAGPDGLAYTLPLEKGGDLDVHVEAVGTAAAPADRSREGTKLEFKKDGERYVADASFPNAAFGGGDLVIAVPRPAEAVAVEKTHNGYQPFEAAGEKVEDAKAIDRVEYYFAINDAPAPPPPQAAAQAPAKPRRIGILWDASMSRGTVDHAREIALLKRVLEPLPEIGVDLVVFRNAVEKPQMFQVVYGVCDPLINAIEKVVYDGGTRLDNLPLRKNYSMLPGAAALKDSAPDYTYWLLFTDGISDLGGPAPTRADVPVFAVNGDDRGNHTVLRYLAGQSGGAYVNLRQVNDEQARAAIGRTPFSLTSVEFDPAQVADVYPRGAQQVQGRVTVTGRLLAPEAKVTLHYGQGARGATSQTFTLRQSAATETGLLPLLWAEQKVADLSVFPDENREELLKVGRTFNLATPATSLLVLETADQYVQHRVVPPRSRPEVYKEFLAKIEEHRATEKKTQEQRVQEAIAMWTARTQWWEEKHDVKPGFRFAGPVGGPAAGDVAGVAGRDEPVADAAPTGRPGSGAAPAPTSTPRPQAVARAAPLADDTRADSTPRGGRNAPPSTATPARSPAAAEEASRPESNGRGSGSGDGTLNRGRQVSQREFSLLHSRLGGEGEGLALDKSKADAVDAAGETSVAVKPWDPQTPYLAAMKEGGAGEAYAIFLDKRKTFGTGPAFYLDCADYFLQHDQREVGIRVLSDVAELRIEDPRLMRIVAYRLQQLGEFDAAVELFERVRALRPEEPQSHRDLGLALADRADHLLADKAAAAGSPPAAVARAMADYRRSLELLNAVIVGAWDRFPEIQVVALMEANRTLARARAVEPAFASPLDARLTKLLDLDVRVVMTWDTDATDMDLWLTEPSGERCFYQHNRTTIGGLLSHDFTDGYGPEEYCLRKLMPGSYKIQANFYGSRNQSLVGPTTVQATVITHFGRPDEKRQSLTLRLTENKEVVDIGTVTLK